MSAEEKNYKDTLSLPDTTFPMRGDLVKNEPLRLERWNEQNLYQQIQQRRKDEGAPRFILHDGPPFANGDVHMGTALNKVLKDLVLKSKTMAGFETPFIPGWDCHGLPIEFKVMQDARDEEPAEIRRRCEEFARGWIETQKSSFRRLGVLGDWENPYLTLDPAYESDIIRTFATMIEKGLVYQSQKPVQWSYGAKTALAEAEVEYQDKKSIAIFVKFDLSSASLQKLTDHCTLSTDHVSFAIWTTTPWTLPSNTALTVGAKIDYVVVATYNQYTFEPTHVILAKNLVAKQFAGKYEQTQDLAVVSNYNKEDKKIPFLIAAHCKGSDLLEIRYEQLLDYATPDAGIANAFRVIAGDFVTTEDGTGIVHTAPTFGADDAMVAKQAVPQVPPMLVKDANENLVPLVDLQGKFRPELREFAGKYVKNEYYDDGQAPDKSVDVELAIKLKIENKAFKVEKYVHSYPNCWRTDKPILYYPLDSWFIKVTNFKDRMHELNKTINWKPKATGEGRFGNWLANANDWNLSRSRYWGIPLPLWRTEDGTEEIIVGSIEELKAEMQRAVTAGVLQKDIYQDFVVGDYSEENYDKIDLHKNIVDNITLVSASGKPMKREADLIDVWFDSGSMPYAQWHYPFENKEKVENIWRKADFIAEGVDQTRGWFYTLHAIATMIFDDVAYKNVVSNGLVLDKNGQKMSKRLGNATDPFETLDKYGPDATRWYMISNANPWDNLKFDIDGIGEVRNKFFGTLYNTYNFFALYANLDGFTYSEPAIAIEKRPEIDRWIVSELNTLILTVDQAFTEYEPTKAARAIQNFVGENLSNWFVRLSRRRYWKGSYGEDKISAYQTLYTCLETVAKLGAPIAPFFMDRLYKDLVAVVSKNEVKISVHLTDFPVADTSLIDSALEARMQKAQTISSLVLSLRQREKIKVRQPLQKIMVPVLDAMARKEIQAVSDLIKSEVNVKEIELIDEDSGILVKQIKPDFKKLGPRFGKDMKAVAAVIMQLGQDQINLLEKEGQMAIKISEKSTTLTLDDVIISSQDIEGWLVANSNGITVALDVTISETLKNEGIAREIVNRIQNLRKDSGFEVTDRIHVSLLSCEMLDTAVAQNLEYIKEETLTDTLSFKVEMKHGTEISFDGIQTKLSINK